MAKFAFGEEPRKPLYSWRVRLLYQYIVIDVVLLVALATLAWEMTTMVSIDVPWVVTGLIAGVVSAMYECIDVQRRVKHGRVMNGCTFIYSTKTRSIDRIFIGFLILIILVNVFIAVIRWTGYAVSVNAIPSFLIGVFGALSVFLPSFVVLLESRFGKLCVLLR